MLSIPTRGISRSIKVHKVDLGAFCDWIEASVLFHDGELSSTDVVDSLTENHIYESQDFAAEMIASAWAELRRRHSSMGTHAPIEIAGQRIVPRGDWRDDPAHSFCLLLSIGTLYQGWTIQFGRDYTEQGELFEKLTRDSATAQFAGWDLHLTGWSRTNPDVLQDVVAKVGEAVGENVGQVERWTSDSAKEAGLDLVLHRRFPDLRVGGPVYLFQCASGADWPRKVHTPEMRIWTRIVEFTAEPKKAFATPFALSDNEFVRYTNLVNGMLMDRYRLLSAVQHDPDWLSMPLRGEIIAWMEPRVVRLPLDAS
jgi:hypothetical protein